MPSLKKQQRHKLLLVLLGLGYVGLIPLLFLTTLPSALLFSIFPLLISAIQCVGGSPVAFILCGVSTLVGMSFLSGKNPMDPIYFASMSGLTWGGVILLYVHFDFIRRKEHASSFELDGILKKKRNLEKDIEFYAKREQDLLERSRGRRKLSDVARVLGSQLDPAAIQEKLIEAAQDLFQGRFVQITVGQEPDAVDRFVLERKQSILIPASHMKGDPQIAAPITIEGSVAGIIRVGGEPSGPLFAQDDLRTLEVLASLASASLDNTSLFARVQENALRDHLTGLWTHKAFQDQLEAEILNASRYHQKFSIILTDIDHFKAVNDTYGHQAGDQILRSYSQAMARSVRDIDFVARYGGEEFVALLLGIDHNEAVVTAEAMRVTIEGQRTKLQGKEAGVTGSFGVATFPEDATSAQQLLRKADERLYQAKKAGRNRVFGQRVGGWGG